MVDKPKSRRDQIRDLAERAIRQTGRPMHNSELTALILTELGLTEAELSAKTVNTSLHDDPAFRFSRVAAGTWSLRER